MTLRLKALPLLAAVAVAALAAFGSGALNLRQAAGSPYESAAATVMAASLTLNPSTAVPNQSIIVSGAGFTAATTSGGAGPNGVHQITGTGVSFVIVAGIQLGPPHVTYPINLDSAGALSATVVVPVTLATLSAGGQTVQVTDDRGITASATLTVPQRTFTLDPATSLRGTTVTARGTGFPASNPATTGTFPVSLDYAGTASGIVTPDGSGSFEADIEVPLTASIPSTNTVTATVIGKPATSTATHSVPRASITLIPASGPPGSSAMVTGSNFPAFASLTSLTIGGIQALSGTAANTNGRGEFVTSVLVPQLPAGDESVMATAGGVTAVALYTVTQPVRTPTPTPRPTPTPSPWEPVATALEPLMAGDNLIRVWNFDNATKFWTFFDPRPAFSSANTIFGMSAGEVYWIRVASGQTATLNGRQHVLVEGWNLVSW